jgi:hypothetical protein
MAARGTAMEMCPVFEDDDTAPRGGHFAKLAKRPLKRAANIPDRPGGRRTLQKSSPLVL